jgi:hypothetical protein
MRRKNFAGLYKGWIPNIKTITNRKTSGLGNRYRDPTQAYWNSPRPTGAKVFEKCELWLE